MKKQTRMVFSAALLVLLLLGLIMSLRHYKMNEQSAESYEEALDIAFSNKEKAALPDITPAPVKDNKTYWIPAPVDEADEHIEQLTETDFDALREVNEDVLGWIMIPGTKVNYPVVQGEDNEYYLKHKWDKKKSDPGAIFLEHRNSSSMTEFNTIIYGHNMRSGSMFGTLDKYAEEDFAKSSPYVYLATDWGVFRYEIFSAHKAPLDNFAYGLSFNQRETREKFIQMALEQSEIQMGVTPEITDLILTLSTCSGISDDVRWVVHARLKMIQLEQ